MRNFFKVFLKIILIIIVIIGLVIGYIKIMLPNIDADQTVKIESSPGQIKRGAYLANHVAVCMDCHSKQDWSLFAGPMSADGIGAGGEKFSREMGFPGEIYARNITPAAIGNWTDGELIRAITSGVSKDGSALFPLMNYHRFGQMAQEDVYSIVAYIRTLKPVKNDVTKSQYDFPVNILINTFPKQADYQPIPSKTDVKSYGKYLVNASGCIDCHSKTDKGNVIPGTEFGGGMVFTSPAGTVTSSNITFHNETGIGAWSKESFIQRFKLFAATDYQPAKIGSNEINTPMPWNMYAGMTDEDLSAIYTYLKSLTPIDNKIVIYNKRP